MSIHSSEFSGGLGVNPHRWSAASQFPADEWLDAMGAGAP
jgi:hypothetical protein